MIGGVCQTGFPQPGSNFAMQTFQGGVTRLPRVGFVTHQIRAKFTLAVAYHHHFIARKGGSFFYPT